MSHAFSYFLPSALDDIQGRGCCRSWRSQPRVVICWVSAWWGQEGDGADKQNLSSCPSILWRVEKQNPSEYFQKVMPFLDWIWFEMKIQPWLDFSLLRGWSGVQPLLSLLISSVHPAFQTPVSLNQLLPLWSTSLGAVRSVARAFAGLH